MHLSNKEFKHEPPTLQEVLGLILLPINIIYRSQFEQLFCQWNYFASNTQITW